MLVKPMKYLIYIKLKVIKLHFGLNIEILKKPLNSTLSFKFHAKFSQFSKFLKIFESLETLRSNVHFIPHVSMNLISKSISTRPKVSSSAVALDTKYINFN